MRRPLLLLATLWPLLLSAQATLPRTFGVSSEVPLRIWVPAGSVRIETWDRDSIRVTGSVGRGVHFFGGGGAKGAKVGIENDDLKATTLAHGDLVVTVPRKAHIWVKMTEGEVVASRTAGELEVITVAGTIAVHDAEGVVSIETIDATVAVARASGAIRVRSGSGKLTLTELHGTLTTATVSGGIELVGDSLPDARLESITGPVQVRGKVARDAIVDIESHSGTITLQLDRTAVPALALSSRAGSISNPLGKGDPSAGRIVAHTFKGAINVSPTAVIERRKPGSSP